MSAHLPTAALGGWQGKREISADFQNRADGGTESGRGKNQLIFSTLKATALRSAQLPKTLLEVSAFSSRPGLEKGRNQSIKRGESISLLKTAALRASADLQSYVES